MDNVAGWEIPEPAMEVSRWGKASDGDYSFVDDLPSRYGHVIFHGYVKFNRMVCHSNLSITMIINITRMRMHSNNISSLSYHSYCMSDHHSMPIFLKTKALVNVILAEIQSIDPSFYHLCFSLFPNQFYPLVI